MSTKYDFAAWLDTKNAEETYKFSDACGACGMGQYMASRGQKWDFDVYNEYISAILDRKIEVLSAEPQNFGAARQRLRDLLDA